LSSPFFLKKLNFIKTARANDSMQAMIKAAA